MGKGKAAVKSVEVVGAVEIQATTVKSGDAGVKLRAPEGVHAFAVGELEGKVDDDGIVYVDPVTAAALAQAGFTAV
jgi:hypothetical protein